MLLSTEEAISLVHGEMETVPDGERTHQAIQTNLADVICGGESIGSLGVTILHVWLKQLFWHTVKYVPSYTKKMLRDGEFFLFGLNSLVHSKVCTFLYKKSLSITTKLKPHKTVAQPEITFV